MKHGEMFITQFNVESAAVEMVIIIYCTTKLNSHPYFWKHIFYSIAAVYTHMQKFNVHLIIPSDEV